MPRARRKWRACTCTSARKRLPRVARRTPTTSPTSRLVRPSAGRWLKRLVGCHVLAVQNLDHDLVFFAFDSHEVNDIRSRDAISRVVRAVRDSSDKRILLIGRASRIGPLGYNRRLSGLRARAVGDQLANMGIELGRISTLTFGYEPPQIDSRIASAYGLADLYAREGQNRLNQSVMMVVY